MRRHLAGLTIAAALFFSAGPVSATTPSTTPDCAEHGHDAEHNPHCDDDTTTTTSTTTTTTTTLIPGLPTNPTTTTSLSTTTTTEPAATIEPPHLDSPPTTPAPVPPTAVLGTVERLPRTGLPIGFLCVVAVLAVAFGLALRRLGKIEEGSP